MSVCFSPFIQSRPTVRICIKLGEIFGSGGHHRLVLTFSSIRNNSMVGVRTSEVWNIFEMQ
jgi:hypothetical protein